MFWLIESQFQYEELLNSSFHEAFIELIPINYNIHPAQNSVCAVYIHPIESDKGYMVNINHPDALELNNIQIQDLLKKFKTLYIRNKKDFLYYFHHKSVIDLTLNNNFKFTGEYKLTVNDEVLKDFKEINKIVPISKHYEFCTRVYNELKNNIGKPVNPFYNNKTSLVFYLIEKNGLKVNKEEFENRFHEIDGEFVYTHYNFKTTTTRPSNAFNNVNFAALNKDNGDRKCFIPSNHYLVELDISAYHPTLLSKIINYIPKNDNIYDDIIEETGLERDKVKLITLKQMYGGVWQEYEHLEYFQKLKKYIDSIWKEFNSKGQITCPISNHIYYKEKLTDMTPNKLLSYILQNLETAYNVHLLWEILQVLWNKDTKLVLYTYDAILLDYHKKDKEEFNKIKEIFEKRGLKISIKYGKNYDF